MSVSLILMKLLLTLTHAPLQKIFLGIGVIVCEYICYVLFDIVYIILGNKIMIVYMKQVLFICLTFISVQGQSNIKKCGSTCTS